MKEKRELVRIVKAPEAAERKLDVKNAADPGAVEAFAAALKAAL